MQGVVGQVVHGHGRRQGWAWGRGGVGEAPQRVLIPPEIHIIVEALQGLRGMGGDQFLILGRENSISIVWVSVHNWAIQEGKHLVKCSCRQLTPE